MGDKVTLTVVADISGSMKELGKIMIVRNLLAYIRERMRLSPNCQFWNSLQLIIWGENTSIVELTVDHDLPHWEAKGKSNSQQLIQILNAHLSDQLERVLLLSDGNFTRDEFNILQKWLQSRPNVSLRTVAVGADASLIKLEKLTGSWRPFLAENISQAVSNWPVSDKLASPPIALQEIIHLQVLKQEAEDEWA